MLADERYRKTAFIGQHKYRNKVGGLKPTSSRSSWSSILLFFRSSWSVGGTEAPSPLFRFYLLSAEKQPSAANENTAPNTTCCHGARPEPMRALIRTQYVAMVTKVQNVMVRLSIDSADDVIQLRS